MKRIILKTLLLLLLTTQLANAQTKTFYMGLGGSSTSFQDLKYSSLRYGGYGGILELQFRKNNENATWATGLTLIAGREKSKLFEHGSALTVYPQLHFSYLRNINENLSIGGRWDILEMYFRLNNSLGNNGIYYNTGSYLSASGIYNIELAGKPLKIGLDLGILAFFKESTSFAFSASQAILESGEFNLQDDKLSNPFAFKYFVTRLPWQHFRLATTANYQLSKRFSIHYRWHLRRFSEVQNHPITSGANTLSVRFHFTNKSTTKAKK